MAVSVLIDGIDLAAAFGIHLEDGGLDVFEQPPTPREPFFNEWLDQSGRDYDETSPVVYEPQTYEVPFLMLCGSMTDYRTKKAAFLELIVKNGEFDLQIIDWGEAFRLRYKSTIRWEFINESLQSETSARFALRLERNFNHGYMFKYLADNTGRYIVINGKKMMVKTTYL